MVLVLVLFVCFCIFCFLFVCLLLVFLFFFLLLLLLFFFFFFCFVFFFFWGGGVVGIFCLNTYEPSAFPFPKIGYPEHGSYQLSVPFFFYFQGSVIQNLSVVSVSFQGLGHI